MWPDESEQTPARAEAMRRPMRRYQVEDAVKHAALKHTQAGFGHLEQPAASTALWKPSIAIVAQRFIGGEAAQILPIRQALHQLRLNFEEVGQVLRRCQFRHRPTARSHPGDDKSKAMRRDRIAVIRSISQPGPLQSVGELIATANRRLRELRTYLPE